MGPKDPAAGMPARHLPAKPLEFADAWDAAWLITSKTWPPEIPHLRALNRHEMTIKSHEITMKST